MSRKRLITGAIVASIVIICGVITVTNPTGKVVLSFRGYVTNSNATISPLVAVSNGTTRAILLTSATTGSPGDESYSPRPNAYVGLRLAPGEGNVLVLPIASPRSWNTYTVCYAASPFRFKVRMRVLGTKWKRFIPNNWAATEAVSVSDLGYLTGSE
ncbi:MAG: hypothetical protein ACXWBP_07340 [Limisphaerales bacterium]